MSRVGDQWVTSAGSGRAPIPEKSYQVETLSAPFRVYLRVYLLLVHPDSYCDRMRRSASMISLNYQ
jgi:hypothetical protein